MENEQDGEGQAYATGHRVRQNDGDTSPRRHVATSLTQHHTEPTQHSPNYDSLRDSTSSLDMTGVSAALPDYTYQTQQQTSQFSHQFATASTNHGMIYPYQSAQYTGMPPAGFAMPFAQQLPMQHYQGQRMYNSYSMNLPGPGAQSSYPGQALYPGQMMGPNPTQNQFHQFPQNPAYAQMQRGPYMSRETGQYQIPHGYGMATMDQVQQLGGSQELKKSNSNGSLKASAALRGPPRKPKQSGHALWVGNLPPGTNIIDLKDHFSRDATDDIESVFLISKSNCAFVNYKSEQTCSAAMNRFHDSRFMGVRLVCRLRRGSTPGSGPTITPTGPSAGTITSSRTNLQANLPDGVPPETEAKIERGEEETKDKMIKERFFIIKSLTMEDLERSVQNGIWATQSHNEVALNKAYKTAENVYLIFSANKSGEYFGYARMDTQISDEAAANLETLAVEPRFPQPSDTSLMNDAPLTIQTNATATAPKGHIIDDSARGTIFWEAESVTADLETVTTITSSPSNVTPSNLDHSQLPIDEISQIQSGSSNSINSQSTTFGKPFKITWMSTDRLAFYKTRGLRNPWNTNREVKIARDGTELEPTIGRKLVGMFGTNAGGGVQRSQQQGQYPMNLGQGPAYRPY